MSRYTDVDALKKTIDKEIFRHDTIDHVFQIIDDAPSIEIIRCGECKYWRAYETWSVCELWTGDPYEAATTNADDFCSYGEREGE